MTRGFFGALALWLVMALPASGQSDPCTVLFAKELDARDHDRFALVSASLGDNSPDGLGDSGLLETADYWVTITTGPALGINCSSATVRKEVFFPIGLVLRPIVDLPVAGQMQTIFQTEYGLRVIVPAEAIAPVRANDAYVFADSNAVHKVCTRGVSVCDAGARLDWFGVKSSDWPFVSGQFSYLHTEDVAGMEQAQADWAAFRRLQDTAGSSTLIGVSEDPFPTEFDAAAACVRREARLHMLGTRPDPTALNGGAEYPTPVRYRLCFRDPNNVVRGSRIRIVTRTLAEGMFKQLWSATTPAQLNGSVDKVIRRAFDYSEPFLTQVGCGERIRPERKSYGRLDTRGAGEGVVDLSSAIVRSEELRKTAFHFRPYQTHTGLSDRDFVFDAPMFQDVELEVGCSDGMLPVHPRTLRIHYQPLFPGAPLVLDLAELNATYDRHLVNYGRNSDAVRTQRLSDGKLFRICDFNEYIMWRAVLKEALSSQFKVQEAAQALDISSGTMADYFTHLIMATVFVTDARLRSRSDQGGTCESDPS